MDTGYYLKAIFALLFVIGLIAGTSFILKRFSLDKHLLKNNKKKRLSVKEMLPLDARRRVILIERDNKEHLILLGHNSDIVIESNITPIENESSEDNK